MLVHYDLFGNHVGGICLCLDRGLQDELGLGGWVVTLFVKVAVLELNLDFLLEKLIFSLLNRIVLKDLLFFESLLWWI